MRSSSSPFSRIALLLAGVLMAHLGAALPASALRVCTYNVENWPEDSATRTAYFRTIMAEVEPDVIVLQEVESQLGVNQFLLNVLDYVAPGEYWMMPFVNGPDTDNACYYKIAVVDSIFHEQIDTPVRQTSVYRFRLDGYQASEAEFTILSTHLKAGIDPSDEQDRLDMTTVIREYLNDYPPNSHFMVAGDFNLRTSSEASYQMLVGYQADNDGRSKDPINSGGYWHDNSSFRYIHSQSTRLDWGGMDDRYDFILVSYALDDGEGLSYVDGSYVTFGNDGLRLNLAINDPPNQVVSAEVADALHDASDHVPVYLEIQVPAKVEAATSLEFGTVIVGAPAPCETLTVTNAASAPADELEYGLTAPAGFSAPTGSFILGSGQSFDHAITMETASAGAKSGDLVIDSNDVDSPSWNVALSGTVLDHASPSLVESGIVLEDTLDFGAAAPGTHGSQMLPVYNEGYDDLQALLEVYDAEIVGGDGRFSFVGGFTAKTAGSDPAEYEIACRGGRPQAGPQPGRSQSVRVPDDPGPFAAGRVRGGRGGLRRFGSARENVGRGDPGGRTACSLVGRP